MSDGGGERLSAVLEKHERGILDAWLAEQGPAAGPDTDLRRQSEQVLRQLMKAAHRGDIGDIQEPAWDDLRGTLTSVSHSRARRGARPADTAHFILSLKQPLFQCLEREAADPATAAVESLKAGSLLDRLALWIMESYQQAREDVIVRQQQEVLELSTPVVKLWKGVLALPLIGTLDSERTEVVMETLLQRISETGSRIAIIDITGVPAVDTRVAQHLLQTVAAARLMGADCIISGVRPQIAQTIVHLGLVLQDVATKSSLADAFAMALDRLGLEVVERSGG